MNVPPVLRTTGIEPYLIAVSWVSPHGSKIEGTRMKSAPAYIYHKSKCISNFQGHTADVSGKRASRKKEKIWKFKFSENILSVIEAHHKSNKGEHGQHEKNAIDWLNSQNHFEYEDLGLNQAIQPAGRCFISIDKICFTKRKML